KALHLSQSIRDRTARFPGAPGSTGGPAELVSAVRDLKEVEPPLRRKTKSWRPLCPNRRRARARHHLPETGRGTVRGRSCLRAGDAVQRRAVYPETSPPA